MRNSTIGRLTGLVTCGLISLIALCGPVSAQLPDDYDPVQTAKWLAYADELQARPAWQWLNADSYVGMSHTFDGGMVHFVGYFRIQDLNSGRLSEFDNAPVNLSIMPTGVELEFAGPVQVLRFQLPSDPNVECGALVQVWIEKNNLAAAKEASRIVASYAHHLPQRPLIPSCREGPPPPMPAGFSDRIDIKHFGPLLNEPQRSCAQFTPIKTGTFSIAADTRIDNRRILVGEMDWFRSEPPFAWSYAHKHFDFFMRGFKSYFFRSGLKELVRHDYGNYDPRPQDIIVATRVIEDPEADVFCYVVDIEQGSAAQRLVRTVPRAGTVLPWSISHRSLPIYDPGTSLIDWGTETAEGVLRESNR